MIVIDLCQEATSPATCPACSEHRSVSPCILGTQFSDLGVFVLGLGLAWRRANAYLFSRVRHLWDGCLCLRLGDIQMDTSCG